MLRRIFLFLVVLVCVSEGAAQQLSVSLQADRDVAYVNEQVLLTLEVKVLQSAFSVTGELPKIDGVEIISVHKEVTGIVEDSVPYKITTRVFALFANNAETITVPSLRYQALLPVPKQRTDGKTGNPEIFAESQPLQLRIQPTQLDDERVWFAAENVSLTSDWSTDDRPVRAGEPVTHSLMVEVRGQHPAAIPPINLNTNGQARLYPLPPVLESGKTPQGIIGSRQQITSVIAPAEGRYVFQELAIDWWDINAGKWRMSKLPEQELQFVEGQHGDPSRNSPVHRRGWESVGLLLVTAIAVASILFNIFLWRRLRQRQFVGGGNQNTVVSEQQAWRALKRSVKCISAEQHSLANVRTALLEWARVRWPGQSMRRLESVAAINPACTTEIMALDNAAYGSDSSLDPQGFMRTLHRLRVSPESVTETLPGLYPTR